MKTGMSNQFNNDMFQLLSDIQNGKYDVKKQMTANMPSNRTDPTKTGIEGMVFESGKGPKPEIIKVSDEITQKMKEDVRNDFIKNNGATTGLTRTELTEKYLLTIPVKDRFNAAHTLGRIWTAEKRRIKAYFYNEVPGYTPGQKVDTKIMDKICAEGFDASV